MFIEPYFSNTIDKRKKNKLISANTPTLTVNLTDFIADRGEYFALDILKLYLISKKSKKWVYLKEEKYQRLTEKYFKYFRNVIKKNKQSIELHKDLLIQLTTLEEDIIELNKKKMCIDKKIESKRQKIMGLKEQIGIYF